MSAADEFASNSVRSFDWRKLPAGEYKLADNGDIVRIDDDNNAAADKVSSALSAFAKVLEPT